MFFSANRCIVEKQIILGGISPLVLGFLSDTLVDLGWQDLEVSEFGLTGVLKSRGNHCIVITCIPCDATHTEVLISISSIDGQEVELETIDAITLLNQATDISARKGNK